MLCNTQWMMDKLRGRPFQEALSDINLVSYKDRDIRLIEAILLGSRFLPENPHLFQLEVLSRFSRAPAANSPAIDRMVKEAATMVLLMSKQCLVPLYPCVSSSSPGVRLPTQYMPTHVLAITTVKQSQKKRQSTDDDKQEVAEQEEEEEEEEYEKGKEMEEDEEKEEEEGGGGGEEEKEEAEQRENRDEEEEEEEEAAAAAVEEEAEEEDFADSAILALVWGARCGLQVWRTAPDNRTFRPFYHISDEVCWLLLLKTAFSWS